MLILLVRHGHAESKSAWVGDDGRRPLSLRGLAEADVLVGVLKGFAPIKIVSSPLLRCLQTIEPLADALALAVEKSARLVPDAGSEAVAFVRELGDESGPVVLCTHGEVIQEIQSAFGLGEVPGVGTYRGRAKASTWVLDFTGGTIAAARYLPAPLL